MDSVTRQTQREKKAPSLIVRLIDIVIFIITLISVVLLLLSYLSKVVNPNDAWVFALLGLITPILYIANIILLLYWIVRWRMIFILPLIALLLGVGSMTLYFRPHLFKNYDKENAVQENAISIVSFNVAGFIYPNFTSLSTSLEKIVDEIDKLKPDILAMQEFQATPSILQERYIDSLLLLGDLKYKKIIYKLFLSDTTGVGIAIYSRFPIVDSGEIDFLKSNNGSIWADILVARGDTLRVINNHLQTTAIRKSDIDFILSNEFMSGGEGNKAQAKHILKSLRNNFKIRAQQADSVAVNMEECRHPIVVCGDFNDTPFSYVYNRIGSGLTDAYHSKKEGVSNTYRGLYNIFRIDYVLHTKEYKTVRYFSPETKWSDHNPVNVIIAPNPK